LSIVNGLVTSLEAVKKPCVWRFVHHIIHGFVERDVLSRLDQARVRIVVENVAHRFSIPEKNASARVREDSGGAMGLWGKNVDTTSEDTEKTEVRAIAGTQLIRGGFGVAMNGDIV